ncbi:MAG: hypothetical protein ACI3XI_02675 [Eubacteriales bacterium]
MKLLTKIVAPILALMLIRGCSSEFDGITPGTVDEIPSAVASQTVSAPVDETTAEEATEEETTEEITVEETTAHPLDGLSAADILFKSEELAASYTSFVRTSAMETAVTIAGSESTSQISSELRVSGGKASFCRTSGNTEERIFFADGEIYYETTTSKLRVGGHTLEDFIDLTAGRLSFGLFDDGEVILCDNGAELIFSVLSEDGILQLRNALGLPEEYGLEVEAAQLRLTLDRGANMSHGRLFIDLSVNLNGNELMELTLETDTRQSAVNGEVALELPPSEEYVYFTSEDALKLYERAIGLLASFPTSHDRFEFTVKDDALIKSDKVNISMTSKDIYAYSCRAGLSIDRNFNVPGSSGMRRCITFYNFRGCYSQMDNGTVYEDTAIDAANLESTVSYPFKTSFFLLEHCAGMSEENSDERKLCFELSEAARKNIASNLLLYAGVTASDPVLTGNVTAYTYVTLDVNGELKSIGYSFAATAEVDGTAYALERTVSLKIDSTASADVLMIYIETD